MNWENITGDQFPKMVEEVKGVCLLPLSCIERHAHHLPLGTDMFIACALCERAAELEPAIVHPNFIFTQILEARHYPGTIAIDPLLTVKLLENVCREIARNGLKKIVIVNGHGGNDNLIHYFAQIQLASRRDYVVYIAEPHYSSEDQKELAAQWESKVDGHAGERETSAILAIHPELVDKAALKSGTEGMPQDRLKSLRERGVDMGIWWYADHPTHYCGDGTKGTAQKGDRMLNAHAKALAETVKLIKEDKETKRLQDEFFSKTNLPV
jgi:creatinine amidohydrolase